jgi:hypothetical protein
MSRKKRKGPPTADEKFEPTTILNITFELKDYFESRIRKFQLQKVAMGLLNGKECVYLMLKDGRKARVRIEEVGEKS